MQQLTPQQALQNLKSGLDLATARGAFQNLEQPTTLLNCIQIIANELNRNDSSSGTADHSDTMDRRPLGTDEKS